jgi:hypothetical protein
LIFDNVPQHDPEVRNIIAAIEKEANGI